jgi:hypothetical protein
MRGISLPALGDELVKIATRPELLERLRDLLPAAQRAKQEVREHAGSKDPKKWDVFVQRAVDSPEFIRQLERSKRVAPKDVQHAKSMRDLHFGPVLGKVGSSSQSGKEYEIRQLPGGRHGCTCSDWRFRGSTNPGYECRHIQAFKEGKTKVSSFRDQTAAFFDELSKIQAAKQKAVDENFDASGRPFSNLLTQEDEPTDYYPWRPAAPIDEPEIILGGHR